MVCKKCKKIIPSESQFCMHCGANQSNEKKNKPQQRYRGKGFGNVTFFKNCRTNPYRARIRRDGKQIHIGYFPTVAEANQAIANYLVEYNEKHSPRIEWTLQQFYDSWSEIAFQNITKSGINSHKASWNYLSLISHKKMKELKTSDYQECIDNAVSQGKSRAVCEKIRNLISLLCQEAMKDDVIDRNYANLLNLPKSDKKEKGIFTDDEIALLVEHDDDLEARIILVLIYTGLRIGEFIALTPKNIDIDRWIIRGGSKTNAGRNRIIPIIPKIRTYVRSLVDEAPSEDSKLFDHGYTWFRNKFFYRYLISIGMLTQSEVDVGGEPRLTPHSTRHTFASLARRAGVEKDILIRVIGHTDYNTTDENYVKMNIDELSAEMEKI